VTRTSVSNAGVIRIETWPLLTAVRLRSGKSHKSAIAMTGQTSACRTRSIKSDFPVIASPSEDPCQSICVFVVRTKTAISTNEPIRLVFANLEQTVDGPASWPEDGTVFARIVRRDRIVWKETQALNQRGPLWASDGQNLAESAPHDAASLRQALYACPEQNSTCQ
jgi:hypothetical protein